MVSRQSLREDAGRSLEQWSQQPSAPPLGESGCSDYWGWDKSAKSHEVRLFGGRRMTAHFHPNWSNGTAGVRGTRPLNRGPSTKYYWEIKVSDRIFGTSMMFGIATKNCRLHAESFVNMIGEDDQGWGLSHKGLLWHNSQWTHFTKPFPENTATTVGLLYDAAMGTLTYYRDGYCLGVAFTGLDKVKRKLYPMVSSTAAKTEMTLGNQRRDFFSLQDRCREAILNSLLNDSDRKLLQLPTPLMKFLSKETIDHGDSGDSDREMDDSATSDQVQWANLSDSICGAFNRPPGQLSEVPPFPQF